MCGFPRALPSKKLDMEDRLKLALVRILRTFVIIFSLSFVAIFSSVITYGVFSVSLFVFAFLVCFALCGVSCFLNQEPYSSTIVFGICIALFMFSGLILIFQIGCSANQSSMCLMIVWKIDTTASSERVFKEAFKNANVLLVCSCWAVFILSGILTLLAWKIQSVLRATLNGSDCERTNFEWKVPPVDMAQARNDFEAHECSICQDNLEDHHSVILLSCGHLFHYSCLNEWVSRAQMCPICRKQIEEVQLIPSEVAKA